MSKKLTQEEFIEKARKIHGNKYDYSKVKYVNSRKPVTIICPIHGEFEQIANTHLLGRECYKCAKEKSRLGKEEFVKRAQAIHGNKYDYSKVIYISKKKEVCIICPIHGEFWQSPEVHLRGNGCSKCSGNFLKSTEQFIEAAKKVHGDKYDYSKVEYKRNDIPVIIICPKHGEFKQKPNNHLNGQNCYYCAREKQAKDHCKSTEQFIEAASIKHKGKYDYSKVRYTKSDKPVCIICPTHGEFWQEANSHLQGHGCPLCHEISKMEKQIDKYLKSKYNQKYEHNRFYKFLNNLQLDFFLPDLKVAIECQGLQHFKPIDYFGGEESFKRTVERDNLKRKLCEENGIKLFYYSIEKIENPPYEIYNNIDDLFKQILND